MSMQDPIADMLTRIRNGLSAKKKGVFSPYSKQNKAIANIFFQEGYIQEINVISAVSQIKIMEIILKYYKGSGVIETLKRVSRPGLRIYKGKDELPRFRDGFGMSVISTSKGIMNDRKARIAGIGGEVICYVA